MATVATLEAVLKLRDEMSGQMSKTVKNVTGHIASFVSVAGAVKLATDALKAQSEQEAAINKLNLALANQGKLTPALSKSLIDYSAAMQDVSTFADEVVLAGQATLVSFNLNEEQVKRSTRAAMDYAAATGTDLQAAMQLLGRASTGTVTMRQRQGFQGSETMTDAQKFESALKQIEQRFGGSALAATATFGGQLAVLKNQVGEVQEGFGKFLGQLTGGTAPFSSMISLAKTLSHFFGVTLIVAVSELRAQLLLLAANVLDVGIKMDQLLAKLPGGLGRWFAKDAIATKDLADALRIQATQLRE